MPEGSQNAFRSLATRTFSKRRIGEALSVAVLSNSLAAAALASCTVSTSDLAGLWSELIAFGPLLQGVLTIDGRSGTWTSDIAGMYVQGQNRNGTLSFAFPAGQGTFRGTPLANRTIEGFWTQPVPVRSIYRFASPVVLTEADGEVWQGFIAPLPDQIAMYLRISGDNNGNLTAFFRDSDADLNGSKLFSVRCDGTRLTLVNRSDPKDILNAEIHPDSKQISLRIPLDNATLTFDLSKTDPEIANGFFAVVPGSPVYHYKRPLSGGDGWATADASKVGMDPERLAAAVRSVRETQIIDSTAPHIQALAVARHERLVLDEYFFGFTPDETHDLRSTGKSFATALVGIALGSHPELKLDDPILPLLKQYHPENMDARKARLTLRSLMTMTSGLDCDDGNRESRGREMTLFSQTAEPDYYAYTLNLPMVREPGGPHAIYCSAGMNLLGAVIKAITHEDLAVYFNEKIARPLAFRNYQLNLSPTADVYLGGGLYLRARDALKLGQVYLEKGMWQGKRILDARWVEESTKVQSSYSSYHGYGLGWHVFNRLELNGHAYTEYETEGTGGQLVIVIPALDLAVTMLTANYSRDMTDPERALLAQIVKSIDF